MTNNSSSSYRFRVDPQEQGMRLDKFLALKIQDLSRTRLQDLIEGKFVLVDHKNPGSPAFKVREGQQIDLTLPPLMQAYPLPQNIPLDVIFEDQDIIVINKPAGMVVHPAPGNPEGTLVNALLNHCGESLSGINGVKRPGIVHRLDKETSGLLVAAKNDKAHHHLAHQLATRDMGRVYLALVWGMMLPQAGTIDAPIGRDPHHRQRMAIREGGRFARTHYKVLKFFTNVASLVECRLDTGRTHQIRVHLTSKGFSLIGDPLYGKPPRVVPPLLKSYIKEKWPLSRQALHAKELSFIHPTTHEKLHFSTDLPEDMLNLIHVLESIAKL
jgi:23S rRNA pseudouridine1911/1915/1917 synthase